MPKARVKLTPEEEAVIGKGGDPAVSATVEPIRRGQPVPAPERPAGSKVYRSAMIRFDPDDFSRVEESLKRFNKREGLKLSMNSWLVRAAMRQADEN